MKRRPGCRVTVACRPALGSLTPTKRPIGLAWGDGKYGAEATDDARGVRVTGESGDNSDGKLVREPPVLRREVPVESATKPRGRRAAAVSRRAMNAQVGWRRRDRGGDQR